MSAFVEHTKRKALKYKIALIFMEYHFYAIGVLKKKSIRHTFYVSKFAEKVMKLLKDYEV